MNGALKKLSRRPLFLAGIGIALCFFLIAIFAPLLAPHDPLAVDLHNLLRPPGREFPLGTDNLGRCVLSRLIAGSRISLGTALLIEALILSLGTAAGIAAGYAGGAADAAILILIDTFLAFPALILALVTAGLLGPGLRNLVIAFGAVYWVEPARIARNMTRSLKEKEFVAAARVSGSGGGKIIRQHILPHIVPTMLVLAALNMPQLIIGIASLSFIGIGVKPPAPEWGSLLAEGRVYLRENPAMIAAAALCIMFSAGCCQFLGESLRDALQPRASHLRPQLPAGGGKKRC